MKKNIFKLFLSSIAAFDDYLFQMHNQIALE